MNVSEDEGPAQDASLGRGEGRGEGGGGAVTGGRAAAFGRASWQHAWNKLD